MKNEIIKIITLKIEDELSKLKEASATTRKYSQSDDLKSEGKYDTRAVEAKYLAGAQEVRVKQLEAELSIISNFMPSNLKSVQIGSIVEFQKKLHFIVPISGQGKFTVQDMEIKTISHMTEIFDVIKDLEVGDEFEHPISAKELRISKVI
jgi:hypothetical protein